MCGPSSTQKVRFIIDERGTVMKPVKLDAGGEGAGLSGTKWKWVRTVTPVNTIEVSKPENYTLSFGADGRVAVKSDCNTGSGSYKAEGSSLTFSGIALTRRACLQGSQDSAFNRGLAGARVYRRDGDKMIVDMLADSGTMHFERIP